jgi:hypothetical protein
LIKTCQGLNGKTIKVGVFEGENAWLAGIHEHGCKITVTPKMRAFLHRNGIHLKKDTTQLTIPERSFLRSGFDQNIDDVNRKAQKLLDSVMAGRFSVDKYLEEIGLVLSSKIKTFATKLSSPPNVWTWDQVNSPLAKKSSNPLVDSEDMIEGITYRIE